MVEYTNFLSRLHKINKQQLLELGIRKHFIKDEIICSIGRENENIYLLITGRIKLYELNTNGKEVILWFCTPGELFGIPDALLASHFSGRHVRAQACGYVEVLCIKYPDFLQYLTENPAIALPLIQLLSFRLREVVEVLSDVTCSDVTSRVIKLLMRLSGQYGKQVERGVFLELPITHQEMADMIGASRQTVTTVLGDLKRQGLVQIEQRTIFMRNGDWLYNYMDNLNLKNHNRQRLDSPALDESMEFGV